MPLEKLSQGYYRAVLPDFNPPGRYVYRLYQTRTSDPIERPDPASRCQPEGVHGPSQVVDQKFDWEDAAGIGIGWHCQKEIGT